MGSSYVLEFGLTAKGVQGDIHLGRVSLDWAPLLSPAGPEETPLSGAENTTTTTTTTVGGNEEKNRTTTGTDDNEAVATVTAVGAGEGSGVEDGTEAGGEVTEAGSGEAGVTEAGGGETEVTEAGTGDNKDTTVDVETEGGSGDPTVLEGSSNTKEEGSVAATKSGTSMYGYTGEVCTAIVCTHDT